MKFSLALQSDPQVSDPSLLLIPVAQKFLIANLEVSGRETEARQKEVERWDQHRISRIPTLFAIKYIPVSSYTWLLSVTEERKMRFTSFGVGHEEVVHPTSLGAWLLAALAGARTVTDWQWDARRLT